MTSTELATRTNETIQNLEHPVFLEQVEALLPDTVPLRRFVQVSKTAIRVTPDLVTADQTSLFGALVRCAQDGLFPDNREAALVPYKGKVSYIPMIGGIRKIAAEHGWTIRTRVVFENDEFDYTEEPPTITHKPVRPGTPRGDRIASYAVATHKDGRREQIVLHPDQIAKRRARAQTAKVWDDWTDAMWEKSAGHAIFPQLAISDRDLIDRIDHADETDPAEAAALLYGPNGDTFTATALPSGADAASPAPQTDATPDGNGDPRGGDPQAAPADRLPAAGAAAGDDEEEPEPTIGRATARELADAARAVASTVIPNGGYQGMTLDQIAEAGPDGETWLWYALRHPDKYTDQFNAALGTFVQGAMPALYDRYAAWVAEKQAA
jgi:recombination protein RecT